jgi:methyl-accepting chemotaxis protein
MVAQIATAANEQTSAVEDINRGVAHISEITQQSEATAEESSATCKDLQSLAEDLERLMSRFKLEADIWERRRAA